ncbi:putative peptidylprolyl isomerase [Helianthus annuus]|nr:putative peptidylprolyl isomerase [Helianthus annuus]KAJ0723221.1 putative peptidylprolyl isomerase [Helianthus annuus]
MNTNKTLFMFVRFVYSPTHNHKPKAIKTLHSLQKLKLYNFIWFLFVDIIDGEGKEAREGDLVEVNYVCRRSNGYFVHSTVDQFSGESSPVILPLNEKEIIKGLKEVIIGMKAGGMLLFIYICYFRIVL